MIASRSSTTASVSRNVRSAVGRWVDSTASTASAKAMSVAIGTAHPSRFSGWPATRLMAMKIAAGKIMPPTAAAIGSAARAGSRRSPATNSRLSSTPTTKKKIASRPSAAHVAERQIQVQRLGADGELRQRLVGADHGEFAQTSAAAAANSSSTPPTVSLRRISEKRLASAQEPRVSIALVASRVSLVIARVRASPVAPPNPLRHLYGRSAGKSGRQSRQGSDLNDDGSSTWRQVHST